MGQAQKSFFGQFDAKNVPAAGAFGRGCLGIRSRWGSEGGILGPFGADFRRKNRDFDQIALLVGA